MPCEELETGRGGNIYTVETGSLQMSGLCVCVCVCVCLVVLENQRLSIANVPLAVWISHILFIDSSIHPWTLRLGLLLGGCENHCYELG